MSRYIIPILLILLSSFLTANAQDTILEKGLEFEKNGEYEEALIYWLDTFIETEYPSPAIGREFARIATEQSLTEYYEFASLVYFYGLSAQTMEETVDELRREVQMMQPIMEKDQFDELISLIEQRDPLVYEKMEQFWNLANPTPGSEHNGRLLEHWERIAYAKENFTRSSYPPFGTDARGAVYVQYGEPDRRFDGILEANRGRVETVSNLLDPGADQALMADIIMGMHIRPEYEIWIYGRPTTDMNYNLVQIFGEMPNGGFRQVQSIDDFIPMRAFSLSISRYAIPSLTGRQTPASINVTPGMIYQYIFYEDLSTIDPFFSQQFSAITSQWESAEMAAAATDWDTGQIQGGAEFSRTMGRHSGQQQKLRHQTEMLRNMIFAPPEFSTYERQLPDIPIDVYQYRLLDEDSRPVFATYIESKPGQAFLNDFAFNEEKMYNHESEDPQTAFNFYELKHGLQLISDDEQIISQNRMQTDLIIDFEKDYPSQSVFVIPYVSNLEKQVFFAELHNSHPDSDPRQHTSFAHSLRGLGKIVLQNPEPLSPDRNQLQVSDLILGYELRQEDRPGTYLPFVVANNREIPQHEALALRFEIYHLQKDEDGFARFQVDYNLQPRSRSFFSRERQDDFSLTLTFETMESRFTENLEIETDNLEPGRFRLDMAFTDLQSGQKVERTIDFEIVEP